MRALLQRVRSASVSVDGETVGEIGRGILIFLGVAAGDGPGDADFLADKCTRLRIFTDGEDKMNLSVRDVDGAVLSISQFTLAADTAKGLRPSFSSAMEPQAAEALYERFNAKLRAAGVPFAAGRFGADMQVQLINDGPVTFLLESSGR